MSHRKNKSPSFSKEAVFPDGAVKMLSLDDIAYKGKKIALYFYPWNGTPLCTKQAKVFNDHLDELKSEGIEVIGVNDGSINSHKKFIKKHSLAFPIVSDTSKDIAKLFNVNGFLSRKTVLLDENRNIIHTFEKNKC